MNRIDRAMSAGVDPGRLDGASSKRQAGHKAGESAKGSVKTEAQRMTAEVLDVIADSVMQRRVQNINVLTASVTRFLLTSLEPAMQFAMDLRDQTEAQPERAVEGFSNDRRNEALAVLSDTDGT
jgi:hypothetical protein